VSSTVDTFTVVSIPVIMEDVEVSIAVAYKGDMVTTGEYSTELDIVLAVPVEIPFVSELN
jgi:hypothetical protein